MKKKTKIILLAVVIGVLIGSIYGSLRMVTDEGIGENLLKNFNFETVDTSGKLQSWTEDPKGGWSVDTEEPYEGEKCMQATVGWSWFSQDIRVKSNRYYLLKAYVKSDITAAGKVKGENTFLTLECIDWMGRVIQRDYGVVSATSSWEEKIRQIYAPRWTKKVRVKLAKRQGEGSVWFDNLQLEQVPSISVINSSFEILDKLGRPKYWKEGPKGGWSINTEYPFEGKRCMQATEGWSWFSQEIAAKPKRYYTLKGYLRSDIVFTEKEDWNAFLTLECLDEKNKVISEKTVQLNATQLWKPQEVSVYAPKNTKKIIVKLAKRKGEGSVWFDEVKMIKSAWYMQIKFLRRMAQDKPFFIFYFSIYFILLISLLRLILKR